MRRASLLLALCAAIACNSTDSASHSSSADLPSQPPAANRMQADHLPTPFSAAQIRAASPSGAVRVFRVTGGPQTITQHLRFTESDAEGASFEVTVLDKNDTPLTTQSVPKMAWTSFQSHASYPAAGTTIERGRAEVIAGSFDCWIYTTTTLQGDSSRSYFAFKLPGGPVLSTLTTPSGQETQRTELVRFE